MTKPLKDQRINEYGVSVFDLHPGLWVELVWSAADRDVGLITAVDLRAKSYRGERGMCVFLRGMDKVWYLSNNVGSSQVLRILPFPLEMPGEVSRVLGSKSSLTVVGS